MNPPDASLENAAPQGGPNILLIEDSATIRRFLTQLFQRELPQACLVEAEDGKAALNQMTRFKADLIVTDLQMPGMDGRAFIAKLRSNALLRRKSVLVLSGDDVADLRALYRDDAGIRFLQKPSSAEDILQASRQLLGGPRGALEARS
jgi:CheY-like chemotaxis protein